ncbi:efflux RND transporter permease subunit [Rickettsiales bacterium]|nr:efflux RND transporter permease subunit [Rickettsiales bacterium]
MYKITEFFIKNSKFTAVITLTILLIGIYSIQHIKSEARPPVDFATAVILTNYAGASASDIEAKITKPIEDEISTISDVKDIKSVSQPGKSTITIRLDIDKRGLDIDKIMADLQRAVDRTPNLPIDLEDKPIFTEIKSEEILILQLAITGSNDNRARDIISKVIKEDLENNKNIKRVSMRGYKERRFNIDLDPIKMSQNNISILEVVNKIRSRNISVPSGNIESNILQALTRIEAKIQNVFDLENIIIRSNFNDQIIKLKDLAKITDSEEEIDVITNVNGNDATLLDIYKKSGADILKLIEQIKQKTLIYKEQYPKINLQIAYDESLEVDKRLNILTSNAAIGLIIVLLSLFVFLPFRVAIYSSISLPIIISAIIGFMLFFNLTLNTITILSLVIVLGMLVDDSVIVSEKFAKYYRKGYNPRDAALLPIKNLAFPISITIFTTIAAFLPMLITKGIMGQFIKWIPIVVSLALFLSLIESFWLLPARLASIKNKVNHKIKETDWFTKFEIGFEKMIFILIKYRYLMLLSFLIVIFTSFFFLGQNRFILFPNEQVNNYTIRVKLDKNNKIENTNQLLKEAAIKILDKLEDNIDVITGFAGISDFKEHLPKYSRGENVAYMSIDVNDYTEFNIAPSVIISKLKEIDFSEFEEITFESAVNGPPIGNDIEAVIQSNILKDIDQMISMIINDVKDIKGISNLSNDDVTGEDEVFINFDYEKINRLNLNISDISNAVRTAIAGQIISDVTLNNEEVNLFVRFNDQKRSSLEDLKNIIIFDQNQNLILLKDLANFEKRTGSAFIKRFDNQRSKTLIGDVDEDIITPTEANQLVRESFEKYKNQFPGITVKFAGVEESTNESLQSLFAAFQLSLILIFAMLVLLFRSYFKPLIILSTVPLGFFGFSIAFYLHDKPLSFMAMIGIIGLSGIIVNSGIILVSYINQLREEFPDKKLSEILSYASSMRLRSVTITSFTTIAGLFPTAYGLGGYDPILSPMTLSLLWGLSSGTILTIIWVPCSYAILEDIKKINFISRFKGN